MEQGRKHSRTYVDFKGCGGITNAELLNTLASMRGTGREKRTLTHGAWSLMSRRLRNRDLKHLLDGERKKWVNRGGGAREVGLRKW